MIEYSIRIRTTAPLDMPLARRLCEETCNAVAVDLFGTDVEFMTKEGHVLTSFHYVSSPEPRS